jgi:putative serine protease PepD
VSDHLPEEPVVATDAPEAPAPRDAALDPTVPVPVSAAASAPPAGPPADAAVPPYSPPAPSDSTTRPATSSHVVAIAVVIAIVGVLASGIVGALAGFAVSSLNATSNQTAVQTSRVIANAAQEPIAAAAAIALPSVVNIDVTGSSSTSGLPQGHPNVPSGGTGSGVAYKSAPDGGTYIITNDHVVSGETKIVVTPASGERIDATLVGTDPQTDIAVVKVAAKLPLITVADSEQLVVGQTVVAIGSPFGLQHSVSSGVVSALHRSLTSSSSSDTSSSAYPLVDVIQTDAAINPGNSGGALVDRQGRLIGIDSAIYTDSGSNAGVGFAIPSKTASRIADELISTGTAKHPFLGVEGRTVTDSVAKQAGLAKAEGAVVESVIAGTGAAKAGLRKGDIVTALDSTPIRTMDDLILAVRRSQVGEVVKLTVWRDRAQITVEMTVGDKPATVS